MPNRIYLWDLQKFCFVSSKLQTVSLFQFYKWYNKFSLKQISSSVYTYIVLYMYPNTIIISLVLEFTSTCATSAYHY